MSQFKKARVIMLPTSQKINRGIWLRKKNSFDDPYLFFNMIVPPTQSNECYQHLYIISDEKPKAGDWYYIYIKGLHSNPQINQLLKSDIESGLYEKWKADCKKIIATTDTSLIFKKGYSVSQGEYNESFPQPSKEFIKKYVDSYNKGEVITDILVEYENYILNQSRIGLANVTLQRLKINSKDNTITVKKLKDSWNREEVIDILHVYGLNLIEQIETKSLKEQVDINKWIEENLETNLEDNQDE